MGSEGILKIKNILLIFLLIIFSGGYSLYSQEDEDAVKFADRLMCFSNYKQAVHYYNLAIESNPAIRKIRVRQGYAYFQLKEYDDAVRVLKEEISLFPDDCEAYILLGYIYFKRDKFEDAMEVCGAYETKFRRYLHEEAYNKGFRFSLQVKDVRLDRILADIRNENQNISLPNFILGLYHKSKGNFSESAAHINLAQRWGHRPVDCYLQLIDIELIRSNWKDALKKTQEALRIKGPQAEFYFMMGYIYQQLKEIENAISCFEKALEIKPFLVEAMRNLSILYYNQQEFKKASDLFERFLRINLHDVYDKYDFKYSLAKLELTKNLVDKMELEYIYPLESEVHFSSKAINEAALALVRNGRLKEAIGLMKNFLKIDDTSPEINYNLGQLYNIYNKIDKALEYAYRAVELDRDFKDAYDLIGNIYFKIHDYERSIQAYREVLLINSRDAMGYYNLGCVFYAAKSFDEAEDCWEKAIKYERGIKSVKDRDKISEDELSVSLVVLEKPIAFRAYKSLGGLYLERNYPEKALEAFKKAIELESNDPEPYYEAGKIYQAKSAQDKEYMAKAISYLEKYLFLGGKKEEEVKDLLKRIKEK
ncbi:MAG: tetratricopeptide repeat protein [Candidatus Aminicenantaceae bacterium]